MELILSEEQRLLKESAAKFMHRRAGSDLVRRLRDVEKSVNREIWRDVAESGKLVDLHGTCAIVKPSCIGIRARKAEESLASAHPGFP